MLPDVHAEQRRLAVGERVVLVRASPPPRGRSRRARARPSRSRTGPRRSSFTLPLKSANEPKASSIASASSPSGSPPPSGDIDSQNSDVVEWPPPLLRTAPRLSSGTWERFAHHVLDRLVGPVGALERGVDLVHVGLVVLVVVHLHRGLVDVRLERVVVVGEGGYLVRHLGASFRFVSTPNSILGSRLVSLGLTRHTRLWRNWQTRRLQVPVPFGAWRFESSQPHQVPATPDGRAGVAGAKNSQSTSTPARPGTRPR